MTANENRTVHIDATLDGDLTLRGLPWTWSVGYNHSAVSGSTTSTGNLNLPNLKKALGPSFKNSTGVIQCGSAAARQRPSRWSNGPRSTSWAARRRPASRHSATSCRSARAPMAARSTAPPPISPAN